MRIAYVVTRADSVGGASIHVCDLAAAMMERGHDVTVLAGGDGPFRQLVERTGVRFRSLPHLQRPIRPMPDLLALGEMTSSLKALRPDLISVHTAKAGLIGRIAGVRTGIPVVYTPHGWSIEDRISRAQGLFFRLVERAAARWSRAIVCVCDHEKQLALKHRIAPAIRLYVVHNGVRDVPPQLRADTEARPVRIVSVARLAAPKDHATLLKSLAGLRAREWKLDLVGDGPDESRIRRLANDLAIGKRVRFLGYQPDPAVALASSQVFVLSSRSEAFPRSVLEAMRAGLAVVASDVGGIREAIADRVSGLLVPRGDESALGRVLAELIDNTMLRKRLGTEARRTYESQFRLERLVANTAAVYEAVLGEGARR